MKILLLSGIPDWAGHRRCVNLQKHLPHDVTIETRHPHEISQKEFEDFIDDYDIVHLQFTGFATRFLPAVMKKTTWSQTDQSVAEGVPNLGMTVVSERTLDGYHGNDKPEELLALISQCEFVTASNPRIVERLKKEGIKSTYIPHGVDTDLFKPRKFRVGQVGAKNAYKGFDLVQKACKELDCEVVTDPSEWPHKVLKHKDMPKVYEKMDCYVCASEAEGCCNPVLEAMAMGIPVISTDVGIAKELDVIIVDRTVKGIKAGILQVMNGSLSLERKEILEKYTLQIIANQYNEIYEKIKKV